MSRRATRITILAGTRHFGGPAHQKADGTFNVVDASGQPIKRQGYIWNNGTLWNQSFVPSTTSVSGVNHWVGQE